MHDQRTGGPHEQPQENVPSVAPSDVVSVQPNETAASEVDDASDPLAALTPVSPSDPVCSSDSATLESSLQDKLGSQIDALYNPAEWEGLSKLERSERLTQAAALVHAQLQSAQTELDDLFKSIPEIERDALKRLTLNDVVALEQLLQREHGFEERSGELVEQLSESRFLLKNGPVLRGQGLFRSSTGFFDGAAAVSRRIAGAAAGATLAGTGVLLYLHHHAIHHFFNEFLPHFGSSFPARLAQWMVAEVPTLVALVPYATVTIAVGATVGALAWGGIKATAGWLQRRNPLSSARKYFQEQRASSSRLQDAIMETCSEALRNSGRLEVALARFYQRNELMREPVSAIAWGLCKSDPERACALRKFASVLGTNEESEIWKTQLLHDDLLSLSRQDVRSPALLRASGEERKISPLDLLRPVGLARLGFRAGWEAMMEIWTTAQTAGTEGALVASHEFDELCLKHRDSIATPLFGLGHASAKALHKIVKTSDLQDTVEGTAEGLASIFDVSKEWHTGPSIDEVFREGLAVEQLDKDQQSEKDHKTFRERLWQAYIRWGFVAGASFVNVAVLAVKKPVIANALIQKRAESGQPTPGLIEKALAKKLGRGHQFRTAMKEVAAIGLHAVDGLLNRIPRELRLGLGARLHRSGSKYARLFPEDSAARLRNRYVERLDRWVNGTHGVRELEAQSLGELAWVKELPIDRLKNVCQRAKLEFLRADRTTHTKHDFDRLYEQAHSLAKYWEARHAAHWLEQKIRLLDHSHALGSIDPRMEDLRRIARPSARSQAEWVQSELELRRGQENPELPPWPALATFVADFKREPAEHRPNSRQIVDVGPAHEFIVLETDGSLSLVKPDEAWMKAVSEWSDNPGVPPFTIFADADEARRLFATAILGPLDPHQTQALILAHHDARSGGRDLDAQVDDLLASDLSLRQLFGVELDGSPCKGGFPGLYRLGLIGEQIPSEEQIAAVVERVRGRISQSTIEQEQHQLVTAEETQHTSPRVRDLEQHFRAEHNREIRAISPRFEHLWEKVHQEDNLVNRVNEWGQTAMSRPNASQVMRRHKGVPVSPLLAHYIDDYNRRPKRGVAPAILDATVENVLVIRRPSGVLDLLTESEGREVLLGWHEATLEKERDSCIIPAHAMRARVVATQLVCARTLDSGEQNTLLNVHLQALEKGLSTVEQARYLAQAGFSYEELFGESSEEPGNGRRMPGLFSLGLIGAGPPPRTELEAARYALSH